MGDLHGTFESFVTIIEQEPFDTANKTQKYIFVGDLVDRGCFSLELVYTLCNFKIAYPDNFFILRGNHETMAMAW